MQLNHHQKAWRIGALASAAALAAAVGLSGPASADPPAIRLIPGVGSDTTQDVLNGAAAVVTYGGNKVLGSYDATGGGTITTQTGGTAFTRPNGSGAGVSALVSSQKGVTTGGYSLNPGDVKFARSSSGVPAATGGSFAYIPYAVDAVSYAFAPGFSYTNIPSGVDTSTGLPLATRDTDGDGILDLTLANIYRVNATGTATVTLETIGSTPNQPVTIGRATSTADIVPLIPQASSGTRKFFLKTLTGSETGQGTAVSDTYDDDGLSGTPEVSIQEHDGASVATVGNAIVPFSIAQWIAQDKVGTTPTYYSSVYSGVTVTDRRSGAVLGNVDGITPRSSGVLNTAFPIKRAVFNVVEAVDLTTDAALNTVFGTTGTGSIYDAKRPSTTTPVVQDFGFGTLPTTGSGLSIYGVTYRAGDTTKFTKNLP